MNRKAFFLSSLLTFFVGMSGNAQSISGIINSYARVATFDTCDMRFNVSDTTGFRAGMRVLLIQMNGATTDGNNSSSFGNVNALNNVGKYEFNIVDSVSTKQIFLRFYLKNPYDDDAVLQIVSYPTYANAVVTDTIRAKPWDGMVGGIIAFEATSLTLNAPIDASNSGFRGGGIKTYANCDALETYTSYFYAFTTTDKTNGGPKGEGIAAIVLGKECGRGAQANGGGGGNNHKSGGGGGGHLAAGGSGGEQKHVNDFRNCTGKYPGFDGKAISGLGNDRLIFGGGGGSGHNREGSNSRGGNGGGIIFIKTNTLTSNGKKIASNGGDGGSNSADGGGGGGAGGTVVLLSSQNTGAVLIDANGGNGGNSNSIGDYDFGPGGGGAGGRVITQTATGVTSSLLGGVFGKNYIQRDGLGAAKGNNGAIATVTNFILPSGSDTISRALFISEQPKTQTICELQTTTLKVSARGPRMSYEWQINRGDDRGFVTIVSDTTFIGINTPTLILSRVRTSLNPYLFRCVMRSECASLLGSIQSDSVGLIIIPAPIALFTSNITYNTVSFTNGTSNGTSYLWDFGNGQTSTQASPTYTYPVQGEYTVKLSAINRCDTNVYTYLLKINTAPKAGFTASTSDYCTPANVRFTSTSSNNSVNYKWLFAGGSPAVSTAIDPSVIYTVSGVYDVVLIVSNANGSDTIRRTNYIRVNSAPAIRFDIARAPNSTNIVFANRTVGANAYAWDFGDGETSTEAAPQHVYRSTGVFIVCMTATNDCGISTLCDTLVLLSLPSAKISVNQNAGCSPFVAQYAGQNVSNVTSWYWTFPGGTPATSTVANPRVTYATAGVYNVSLRISNAAGINTTALDSFIRVLPTPTVKFAVTSVDSTLATFENQSTNAAYYRWDFGDGTGSPDFNPPPHRYYRNGNYTVTLQALNSSCGAVTTRTVPIFVVGTENTEGSHFSIFPNPTDGKWTLDFKTPLNSAIALSVFDARGKIVKTVRLSTESVQAFDFSDLTNGVYFLQFTSANGNYVKKLIKI